MAHPQPQPQATEAESDDSNSLSAQNRSHTPSPTQIPTILHLSFNPDHGRFSVATDVGFRIYSCDPVREIVCREFGKRGCVGLVQTLFRWQFLAIVGGVPDPLSSSNKNKVMIWNDNESRFIGELSFRSEVKGVKCRRDQIIVVLVHKIYVYNFRDLKLLYQIETIENPTGLCEVSHMSGQAVLVCPGLQKGQVRVDHHGTKQTKFIVAHESPLTRLALSQDARLLATASSKGTLIRIFNTLDGSLLQEVRRGAERAEIYSLAFSSTAKWLALSSNKGTVHVFNLKVDSSRSSANGGPEISVPNSFGISSLSVMKGVLPKYFSSEWSMAKYHLQEGLQYIVGFGHQKNTVLILGMDGSFHRCQFDPVNGGVMTQLEYCNFLKPEEAL